jgi:hypothetical protein
VARSRPREPADPCNQVSWLQAIRATLLANFETLVSDPTAGEPAASGHPIVAIGITPANAEAAIPFVATRSSGFAGARDRVVANPIARSNATDNTKAIAGRMRAFRALQVRADSQAQTCSQNLQVSRSVRQLPVARPGFVKARYFRSTVATTTWPVALLANTRSAR